MLPSATESVHAFEAVLFDSCALLRPPEKLTVDEWADKYGQLSPEGSANPGKWYTSTTEYLREPMRVLTPGNKWQSAVMMFGSQLGKTATGLWFAGFHIQHDPAPILFVEPTEDLCKVISRDRIEPMIRDMPILAPLFGTKGGRNTGNDTLAKQFPGGRLSFGWANSPTQLASRPIRILITDEEGRYEANKEGDPVDQARKRMATFKNNRKHLRVSSPGLRRTCRITKAYEQSDQRHYYVPCPDCGHKQVLRLDQLKYRRVSLEVGSYEIADCWYECEACEYRCTEIDKFAMVRQGEWRADNPGGGDGKTAGFQLPSLYSTIGYTWAEIAADYLKCEGIPDKLQVFVNTVLAEAWDEQAEGADLNEVQKHAEPYTAEAPAWVCLVTIGADVQKNRIEATRQGWGYAPVEVSGVIEHRIFHGDPEQPDVWFEFDTWRRRQVQHASGLMLPTAMTLIDSGDGNRTEAVYRYTRHRASQGVFACKGSSTNGAPLVNRGNPVGQSKTIVVSVGTSTAKDVIYARLKIADQAAPGYIHFPDHPESGCDAKYFAQLTAEKLVTRQTKSGEESRWECTDGKRNETLDCMVYNFAARAFLRFNMKQLHDTLWARVAKLRAAGKLPELPTKWTARHDVLARKIDEALQSGSSESSAASRSPQPAPRQPKPKRKRVSLPNSRWIRG